MNYFLVDFENISTDDMKNLDGVCEGDTIVMFFSENRKNISLDFIEEVLKKGANFKTMKANAGTKNALDFQLTSYLGYLIGKYQNNSEYIIVSHDTGYDCLRSFWKNMDVKVRRASFSGADAKKKAGKNNPPVKQQAAQPAKQETAQPTQAKTQPSQPAKQDAAQPKQPVQQKKAASSKVQQAQSVSTESTGKKKAAKKSKVASKDLASLDEVRALVTAEENPAEVLSIINQYKTKSSIANGLSKLYKDTKKSSAVYKKLKPLLKEKNKS